LQKSSPFPRNSNSDLEIQLDDLYASFMQSAASGVNELTL